MKLSFARNRLNALLRTQAFGAVGSPVPRLRTFVIAGLVRVVQGRRHLNTIGCNRAMFTFAPDPISEVTHTPKERTRQPCN